MPPRSSSSRPARFRRRRNGPMRKNAGCRRRRPSRRSRCRRGSQVAALPAQPPKPVVRNIIVRRPRSIQLRPGQHAGHGSAGDDGAGRADGGQSGEFHRKLYGAARHDDADAANAASAEQLGRAFTDLRKQNLDLSPALVLAPEFTEKPKLSSAGALTVKGIFPSKPLRINFCHRIPADRRVLDDRPVVGVGIARR